MNKDPALCDRTRCIAKATDYVRFRRYPTGDYRVCPKHAAWYMATVTDAYTIPIKVN